MAAFVYFVLLVLGVLDFRFCFDFALAFELIACLVCCVVNASGFGVWYVVCVSICCLRVGFVICLFYLTCGFVTLWLFCCGFGICVVLRVMGFAV